MKRQPRWGSFRWGEATWGKRKGKWQRLIDFCRRLWRG